MSNWFVAFGTILLAIIAIFQDRIRSWFWKPKLDCSIELKPPDCHRTITKTSGGSKQFEFFSYYLRFKIWNKGNISAKNVEVLITELLKKEGNSYRIVEAFTPDNLLWSTLQNEWPYYFTNQFKIYCDYLSPNTYKYSNLGHIHDPKYRQNLKGEWNPKLPVSPEETIFSFDINFKSNALYYLISPGIYQIEIKVGCENGITISKRYRLNIKGKWSEDEIRMLNEGFDIKEI